MAAPQTPNLRESVNADPGAGLPVIEAAKVENATFDFGKLATLGEMAGRGGGRVAPSAAVNCQVALHDKPVLNR